MTGESVRVIITDPKIMAVTFIPGIGLGLFLGAMGKTTIQMKRSLGYQNGFSPFKDDFIEL